MKMMTTAVCMTTPGYRMLSGREISVAEALELPIGMVFEVSLERSKWKKAVRTESTWKWGWWKLKPEVRMVTP